MSKQLIVKDEIFIEAPVEKVWEVLVLPEYVKKWDELPEDYPSDKMTEGSSVVWDLPNGGQSITTVIKAEETLELKIALNVTNWKETLSEGDIAYSYKLESQHNGTRLRIEIGDFSLIENGQMYYDASVEFAAHSKEVIKDLAENG